MLRTAWADMGIVWRLRPHARVHVGRVPRVPSANLQRDGRRLVRASTSHVFRGEIVLTGVGMPHALSTSALCNNVFHARGSPYLVLRRSHQFGLGKYTTHSSSVFHAITDVHYDVCSVMLYCIQICLFIPCDVIASVQHDRRLVVLELTLATVPNTAHCQWQMHVRRRAPHRTFYALCVCFSAIPHRSW